MNKNWPKRPQWNEIKPHLLRLLTDFKNLFFDGVLKSRLETLQKLLPLLLEKTELKWEGRQRKYLHLS